MKTKIVIFLMVLLLGLAADSYHPDKDQGETSSVRAMQLSAQTYLSANEIYLPMWLHILFFGGPQPVEAFNQATMEKAEPEVAPEPEPEPEVAPEPEPEPEPSRPVYVYGQPVPETEIVADAFYNNAVIIGDSRSQGLMMYGGMPGANLTGMGVSVYNIWDRGYVETSSGTLTCLQALRRGTYDTVYIGLGINSLGFPSMEKFYENYSRLVDEVRALQPNAVIYVQNIIPVNETVLRAKNYADCFNNTNVRLFNEYIQRIAGEKGLYFLDIYSLFLDPNTGELISAASGDGLHVTAEYAKIWANYLKTHTVNPDVYDIVYPSVEWQTAGAVMEDVPTGDGEWVTLGETTQTWTEDEAQEAVDALS